MFDSLPNVCEYFFDLPIVFYVDPEVENSQEKIHENMNRNYRNNYDYG